MKRVGHFSLMEILVALVIVSVAGAFLTRVWSASLDVGRRAHNVTLATQLGQVKLEEAFLHPAAHLRQLPSSGQGDGILDAFQWTRTVEAFPGFAEHLIRIEVQVSWEENDHKRDIRLRTLVPASKGGPSR